MSLIQIPGTDVWVNPAYVTSIRPATVMINGPDRGLTGVEVEYEGHAGYRTRTSIARGVTVAEVANLFNSDGSEESCS
jgi:hypothetical protein